MELFNKNKTIETNTRVAIEWSAKTTIILSTSENEGEAISCADADIPIICTFMKSFTFRNVAEEPKVFHKNGDKKPYTHIHIQAIANPAENPTPEYNAIFSILRYALRINKENTNAANSQITA